MDTTQNSDFWRLSGEPESNTRLTSLPRRIFSLEAAAQHASIPMKGQPPNLLTTTTLASQVDPLPLASVPFCYQLWSLLTWKTCHFLQMNVCTLSFLSLETPSTWLLFLIKPNTWVIPFT